MWRRIELVGILVGAIIGIAGATHGFAAQGVASWEQYEFVLQWGGKMSDGRLNAPQGVAVDGSGNVYVAADLSARALLPLIRDTESGCVEGLGRDEHCSNTTNVSYSCHEI